jgi:hypothetical protein
MALWSVKASSTVGVPAVRTHETGHALTLALGVAFSMGATIDLTNFRGTVIFL